MWAAQVARRAVCAAAPSLRLPPCAASRSRALLHSAAPSFVATVRLSDVADDATAAAGEPEPEPEVSAATGPGVAGAGAAAGSDSDDAAPGARGPRTRDARERRGRAFLDPRAPRKLEAIRSAPEHAAWGGMIDVLEHAAYCDGQREEDPDGFFFDGVVPEYDSECEGDPFSNGYLTEDELEFDESYAPAPFLPGRVADQIHFLATVRRWPMQRLCAAFHISSERVSAVLALKATEAPLVAAGMYTTRVDDMLDQMYGDRFKKPGNASSRASRLSRDRDAGAGPAGGEDNWRPDFDLGVNYELLKDAQRPDDVYPRTRTHGTALRMGHRLVHRAPPPRKERVHASRFVFLSTSGRSNDKRAGRPMTVAEWDGRVHPATNTDAIYRSWETRYWRLEDAKGSTGMPFADDEADKPASYRVAP